MTINLLIFTHTIRELMIYKEANLSQGKCYRVMYCKQKLILRVHKKVIPMFFKCSLKIYLSHGILGVQK